MCIKKAIINKTPKEEKFQEFVWKILDVKLRSPVYGKEFEVGKLFFEKGSLVITDPYSIEEYSSGFHYLRRECDVDGYIFFGLSVSHKVLVSDVTAYNDVEGCARIMYFPTKEEISFIETDHKPIRVSEKGITVINLHQAVYTK